MPEGGAEADGFDPRWPDKAMFSAILLILAGFVGLLFELSRAYLTLDYDKLPAIFTDDIPYYTLSLCLIVLVSGIVSLRYQAAWPAYVGAACGIASIGVFGLVPALSFVAIGMMVKSHLEGEETRLDGVLMHSENWPDKAMASSLFMVVVGAIAVTQGILMLTNHFDPIVLSGRAVAGAIGLVVGVTHLVAARQVYHLRTEWLGWASLAAGFLTFGFYFIGPLMAVTCMVLLGLAHKEQEFIIHGRGREEKAALEATIAIAEKPKAAAKPAGKAAKAAPKAVAGKKRATR